MDERQELINKIEALLGDLNGSELLVDAQEYLVNAFYNICMAVAKGDGETISVENIIDPITQAIRDTEGSEELTTEQIEFVVMDIIKYFVFNDNLVYVFRAEDIGPTLAVNKRPRLVNFEEHLERMKPIEKAGGVKFRKDGMVN